jgi:hypothetical protein
VCERGEIFFIYRKDLQRRRSIERQRASVADDPPPPDAALCKTIKIIKILK